MKDRGKSRTRTQKTSQNSSENSLTDILSVPCASDIVLQPMSPGRKNSRSHFHNMDVTKERADMGRLPMATPPIKLPMLSVTSLTVQGNKNTLKVPRLQLEGQMVSKRLGPVKTKTGGSTFTSSHEKEPDVKSSRPQTSGSIPRFPKICSTAAKAVAPLSGTPCRQSEIRIQANPLQRSNIQDQRPRSPPAQARRSLSDGSLLQPPCSPVDVLQPEVQASRSLARPKTGIARITRHTDGSTLRFPNQTLDLINSMDGRESTNSFHVLPTIAVSASRAQMAIPLPTPMVSNVPDLLVPTPSASPVPSSQVPAPPASAVPARPANSRSRRVSKRIQLLQIQSAMLDQQLPEQLGDKQIILPSEPLSFSSTERLFLCGPTLVCGDDGCHPLTRPTPSHTGRTDHSPLLTNRRAVQAGEKCPFDTLLMMVPLAEQPPIKRGHMPASRAKAERENSQQGRRKRVKPIHWDVNFKSGPFFPVCVSPSLPSILEVDEESLSEEMEQSQL
uniref:flocculation protein FLO11-like n=1 Tax=Oncorhynchus gorbuscha TaxID=8017 RepID=UPI001EAED178|nr:flocculation protein FLO11-like [Oncorhynchus gorbuscha]